MITGHGFGFTPPILRPRDFRPGIASSPIRTGYAQPLKLVKPVRFSSEAVKQAGKNGLWVTVELAPYIVKGGLGQVSQTIPEALNQHLNKDIRVLMPYWKQMKDLGGFVNTGHSIKLKTPQGQWETFTLMQKADRPGKPTIYAIANETFFGRHEVPYLPAKEDIPGIGTDAEFKSIMMFNRAAGRLIPMLDQSAKHPRKSQLQTYDGDLEFIIVNDWLTSPILNEMPREHQEKLGNVFMLHNTFNHPRSKDVAHHTVRLKKPPVENKSQYSPLQVGVELSDAIIANRHYARRIVHGLYGKPDYIKGLHQKREAGKVFDMHHGLSGEYNASNSPYLREDGYSELAPGFLEMQPKAQVAEMGRFKQVNKQALQKELGLNADDHAVIYSWVARPDPYQKGFQIMADTLQEFIHRHPKSQAVIAGFNAKNPSEAEKKFIETIRQDERLKGRVVLLDFVKNKQVTRINAGSDFLMLPSLYEPYGLSQLEAMILGNIPIVHGVDGLLSTVSDPRVNKKVGTEDGEIVWSHGQTGIIMKPIQVLPYWKALDKVYKGQTLDRSEQRIVSQAKKNFRAALDRSARLVRHPGQMNRARVNGLRFVISEHSWEKIAVRYEKPINAALAAAKRRREATSKPV